MTTSRVLMWKTRRIKSRQEEARIRMSPFGGGFECCRGGRTSPLCDASCTSTTAIPTDEDNLNGRKAVCEWSAVEPGLNLGFALTYAHEAANSSVFFAPVKRPHKAQKPTVNKDMNPNRSCLLSCIALRATIEIIGTKEAMLTASSETKRMTGFRS